MFVGIPTFHCRVKHFMSQVYYRTFVILHLTVFVQLATNNSDHLPIAGEWQSQEALHLWVIILFIQ